MKANRCLLLCVVLLENLIVGGAAAGQVLGPDFPAPDGTTSGQSYPERYLEEFQIGERNQMPNLLDAALVLPAADASQITVGAPGLDFRIQTTFGVSKPDYPEPQRYPNITDYLNEPDGIFIDNSGNL